MCWVMPPASPATTSASRTASSSDVLPWSTWPMIVTTGGRSTRSSAASSNCGLLVDLVRGVDDLDLLVELVGEDLDRVVGERLGERRHLAQLHQLLDDLGDRDGEVLGDVLDRRAGVDPDRVGLERGLVLRHRLDVGATAPAAAAARRAALRAGRAAARAALAARGLRVDDDAAHAAAGAGGALALQRGAGRALGRGLRRRRRRAGRRRCSGAAAAAAAFCASSSWACGRPVSARSAASSSTAEAAALTSIPASASRFSTSAEGMSYCLASSWTRFLAMCG